MTKQRILQQGTFHVTTNTKNKLPWCTWPGVPEILIDNLVMTRNLQKAELFAFCILPDHMHLVLRPGPDGLSAFMHSFKRNSSKDIRCFLDRSDNSSGKRTRATVGDVGNRTRATVGDMNNPQGNRTRAAENGMNCLPTCNRDSNTIDINDSKTRSRGSDTPAIDHQFSGWHNGFHDELIRDGTQRANALSYVQYNAFKHNLTKDPDAWPWSSLQFISLLDEMEIWLD
ncbi:MAG: transposase [Candidatus Peribacteraceae bacterium]|jgi:REP element-mobilizing transposase RayT